MNINYAKYSFLSLFIWATVIQSYCQNGQWAQGGPPIPIFTKMNSSCVFDGKIYVFGGYGKMSAYTSCEIGINDTQIFDPVTNTWDSRTSMPSPRAHTTVELVNNKMYIIGGSSGIPGSYRYSSIEVYDPLVDNWDAKATEIPSRRFACGSCVVDGKIYIIGGLDDHSTGIANVDVYDPANDLWEKKPDLLTPRGYISASYLNGKIYVIGGYHELPKIPKNTVDIFDIASNVWTTNSEVMPIGLYCHSVIVYNGLIYIAGGVSAQNADTDTRYYNPDIFAFDPSANTVFRVTKIPQPGAFLSFHLINGEFYVLGGDRSIDSVPCSERFIKQNIKYSPIPDPIVAIKSNISSSFLNPVWDSISFITSFINPHQIKMDANLIIRNSMEDIVLSSELFDDGLHGDSMPGDGIYGSWIKNLVDEDIFSIEVVSTDDSGNNRFTSTGIVRPFSSIGPIRIQELSDYRIQAGNTSSERVIHFDLELFNEGSNSMAEDISVELFCTDPKVKVITKHINIGDILPGQITFCPTQVEIVLSSDYDLSQNIDLLVSILSGGISFWYDELSFIINNQNIK